MTFSFSPAALKNIAVMYAKSSSASLKTACMLNLKNINSTSPPYTFWDTLSLKDNYNPTLPRSKLSLTGPLPPPAKNCSVPEESLHTYPQLGCCVHCLSQAGLGPISLWTLLPAYPPLKHVFRLHGIPIDIVSDRGPQFSSQVWKEFCKAVAAAASLSSGYHSQTNGQTERANQSLESALRCFAARNPSSWSSFVPWIEYAHNSLTSSAIGMSPFMACYGFQPPLFKIQEQAVAVPFIQDHLRSPGGVEECPGGADPIRSPQQAACGPSWYSGFLPDPQKMHEHDCLWNYKSERYRNKLMKQSLLETLSSLLSNNEQHSFTVEDIKTKFRNLRTIFQREHKTVNSNKTCGSEDFYVPKWKHYRELMFLCESCDEEEQPKDVVFQQPADASIHPPDNQAPLASSSQQCQDSLETNNQTPNIMKMLESPPSPPPIDSQHSMPSSLSSTSSSHTDSGVLGQKRVNKPPPPATIEVLDFMKTFYQSQIMLPHAGFLKYVEECLNETPPDKVKRMKMKIIETIHNMSEEV
ncbi:uncharacterized protein LOC133413642 isoform X3 [Phycodurus eques]|uniref:uncharacterized protein LOC133413642 isoform X3 n=1 Tax=Phycodurus eques TaxID=693459 RepID=UPI002ACDD3AC|nr:uncharacterized protein LOC133413642 isoform X3 [Phycodurus eques]